METPDKAPEETQVGCAVLAAPRALAFVGLETEMNEDHRFMDSGRSYFPLYFCTPPSSITFFRLVVSIPRCYFFLKATKSLATLPYE